jgi:DUF971 family protein
MPWPTEVRLNPGRDVLAVAFDSGEKFDLRAEYLRVESPSAEVRGHGGGPRQIVLGKEDVKIAGLEPVGNYALRIGFDDGHDSGLFSWDYLYKLGQEETKIWAEYKAAAKR